MLLRSKRLPNCVILVYSFVSIRRNIQNFLIREPKTCGVRGSNKVKIVTLKYVRPFPKRPENSQKNMKKAHTILKEINSA